MPRPKTGSRTKPTSSASTSTDAARPGAAASSTPDLQFGVAARSADFPRLPPSPPFLLAAHPDSWTVMRASSRSVVVPLLAKLRLEPGVDNVDSVGGRPRPAGAIQTWEDRGWQVLRDPEIVAEYLRAYKVPGGRRHTTKWETLYPGSDVIEDDPDAYTAWASQLVDRGFIRPPSLYGLRQLRARLAVSLDGQRELADRSPAAAVRTKRLEADLEALDAAIKKFTADLEPSAAVEPDQIQAD